MVFEGIFLNNPNNCSLKNVQLMFHFEKIKINTITQRAFYLSLYYNFYFKTSDNADRFRYSSGKQNLKDIA